MPTGLRLHLLLCDCYAFEQTKLPVSVWESSGGTLPPCSPDSPALLPPAKFAARISLDWDSPFIMIVNRPHQLTPRCLCLSAPRPTCTHLPHNASLSKHAAPPLRSHREQQLHSMDCPCSIRKAMGMCSMHLRVTATSWSVWLHRSASSTVRVVGLSEASSCAAL